MNMTTPLYLHKLPLLSEVFGFFNSGKHMNRMMDHRLWAELDRERDAYELLFKSLGYNLRVDDRGFAWFHFGRCQQQCLQDDASVGTAFHAAV